MKTVTIGDIHGKSVWKKIDVSSYDKIIFVGDYVDSFDISDQNIITNLLEIIEFRKQNQEKVVLLLGNHDIQYIDLSMKTRCSGFRYNISHQLHSIFKDNEELFSISYQIKDTLWTHAGCLRSWLERSFMEVVNEYARRGIFLSLTAPLSDLLQFVYNGAYKDIFYQVSPTRGGTSEYSGPLWADMIDFTNDEQDITQWNVERQIVGHTRTGGGIVNKKMITFTDCLDTQDQFLELTL